MNPAAAASGPSPSVAAVQSNEVCLTRPKPDASIRVAARQMNAIRYASPSQRRSTAQSIGVDLGLCLAGAPVSSLLDELSKKAQALAVEERAQLAQELLESVERDADPDVQAAWEAEIASRIAKYERGEAKLIPAEEVFAAARRLTQ